MSSLAPHPIHKLCYPGQTSCPNLLLAATGPYILSLSLETGELLSKWSSSSGTHENPSRGAVPRESDGEGEESAPKKRKLDSKKAEPAFVLPKVSHLLSTRTGQYVVAVTADDKNVRVFELEASGVLKLLSARQVILCLLISLHSRS